MALEKLKISPLFHDLKDVTTQQFPQFGTKEASLFVFEGEKAVPFSIQRMFTVKVSEPCTRGFHAHKECSQLLVCLVGRCVVTVDDGMTRKDIVLDQPNLGVLIPPTIWAEQIYDAHTVLIGLTDHAYDEADYLRNYEDFLTFRKES